MEGDDFDETHDDTAGAHAAPRAGPPAAVIGDGGEPRTAQGPPAAATQRRLTAMVARPDRRAGQPLARLMRPIVWCAGTDRVRDVAERIGAAALSCALVRTGERVGIVTDLDFRRQV